ncbi:MAG: hypothetical protein IGS03_18950 [Candidatus Sericytochromatia bacterium]|nr:hypothetical protein [Candidatus Sericytochromatia bacterium]
MKRITAGFLSALSLAIGLGLAQPAQASIQRSGDFENGHTLGVGLYGVAYDYGWEFLSIGLSASSSPAATLGNPLSDPLRLSTRVLGRFYQQEGLSAAVLAGLQLDPGQPGNRAYLTPDVGLAVGYDFREFDVPFAVRFNLSLAVSQQVNGFYPSGPEGEPPPVGNFLQRVTFGPSTSLEVAWMPSEKLEFTLGGGTLLGMRLKF